MIFLPPWGPLGLPCGAMTVWLSLTAEPATPLQNSLDAGVRPLRWVMSGDGFPSALERANLQNCLPKHAFEQGGRCKAWVLGQLLAGHAHGAHERDGTKRLLKGSRTRHPFRGARPCRWRLWRPLDRPNQAEDPQYVADRAPKHPCQELRIPAAAGGRGAMFAWIITNRRFMRDDLVLTSVVEVLIVIAQPPPLSGDRHD